MSELAYHANVTCIPQEQFDRLKGYYYYTSHRLLRIQKYVKEVQQEYDENGNLKRGRKVEDEYVFSKEIVQEMESLIDDLEHRLRKMFIDEEKTVKARERMRQLHAEGKISKRGRGKLAKGVAKLRKAQ